MQPDLCGLPSICGHQMVLCNQPRAPQHPPVPAHPKTTSSAMHRVPHYRQLKDPALGQTIGQSHPGGQPHAVSGSSHSLLSVDKVPA